MLKTLCKCKHYGAIYCKTDVKMIRALERTQAGLDEDCGGLGIARTS